MSREDLLSRILMIQARIAANKPRQLMRVSVSRRIKSQEFLMGTKTCDKRAAELKKMIIPMNLQDCFMEISLLALILHYPGMLENTPARVF